MNTRQRWRQWWRLCRIMRAYRHSDPFRDLERIQLADGLFGRDGMYLLAMNAIVDRSERRVESFDPSARLLIRRIKSRVPECGDRAAGKNKPANAGGYRTPDPGSRIPGH